MGLLKSALSSRRGQVFGAAEVLKSYVIGCFRRWLNGREGARRLSLSLDNPLVVGPKGCAAFVAQGFAAHSAFRLPAPISVGTFGPLGGVALQYLQAGMREWELVICGDVSLVGRRLLGAIGRRLRG